MFTYALAELAQLERPGSYYRVLCYCLTKLDGLEPIPLPVSRIMRQTALSRAAVERALAQLIADRVLIRFGRGPGAELRFSRRIGWTRAMREWIELNEVEPEPLIRAAEPVRKRKAVEDEAETPEKLSSPQRPSESV